MATSQHAFNLNNSDSLHHYAQIHAHPTAIALEHISVSELLGRDYLFIDSCEVNLPLLNTDLSQALLCELIQRLDLDESQTMTISVDASDEAALKFVRHELSWQKGKVTKMKSIEITQSEQREFMEMIWRCSTAANES